MFHCKYGTSLLLFHTKILMFLQYTWEDPILPCLLSSLPAFPIQKGIFYPLNTSYNQRYSNSKNETKDKCFVTDLSLIQTIIIRLSIFPLWIKEDQFSYLKKQLRKNRALRTTCDKTVSFYVLNSSEANIFYLHRMTKRGTGANALITCELASVCNGADNHLCCEASLRKQGNLQGARQDVTKSPAWFPKFFQRMSPL